MDKGKKLQAQLDGYYRQLAKPWVTKGRARELDRKIARVERIQACRELPNETYHIQKNHKTTLFGSCNMGFVGEVVIDRGRGARMTTRKAKKHLQKLGATRFYREDVWEAA